MSEDAAHDNEIDQRNAKVKRSWPKQARRYDKSIDFFERRVRELGRASARPG